MCWDLQEVTNVLPPDPAIPKDVVYHSISRVLTNESLFETKTSNKNVGFKQRWWYFKPFWVLNLSVGWNFVEKRHLKIVKSRSLTLSTGPLFRALLQDVWPTLIWQSRSVDSKISAPTGEGMDFWADFCRPKEFLLLGISRDVSCFLEFATFSWIFQERSILLTLQIDMGSIPTCPRILFSAWCLPPETGRPIPVLYGTVPRFVMKSAVIIADSTLDCSDEELIDEDDKRVCHLAKHRRQPFLSCWVVTACYPLYIFVFFCLGRLEILVRVNI